eukprot:1192056-Prorocentrum_minimum.AAC.1
MAAQLDRGQRGNACLPERRRIVHASPDAVVSEHLLQALQDGASGFLLQLRLRAASRHLRVSSVCAQWLARVCAQWLASVCVQRLASVCAQFPARVCAQWSASGCAQWPASNRMKAREWAVRASLTPTSSTRQHSAGWTQREGFVPRRSNIAERDASACAGERALKSTAEGSAPRGRWKQRSPHDAIERLITAAWRLSPLRDAYAAAMESNAALTPERCGGASDRTLIRTTAGAIEGVAVRLPFARVACWNASHMCSAPRTVRVQLAFDPAAGFTPPGSSTSPEWQSSEPSCVASGAITKQVPRREPSGRRSLAAASAKRTASACCKSHSAACTKGAAAAKRAAPSAASALASGPRPGCTSAMTCRHPAPASHRITPSAIATAARSALHATTTAPCKSPFRTRRGNRSVGAEPSFPAPTRTSTSCAPLDPGWSAPVLSSSSWRTALSIASAASASVRFPPRGGNRSTAARARPARAPSSVSSAVCGSGSTAPDVFSPPASVRTGSTSKVARDESSVAAPATAKAARDARSAPRRSSPARSQSTSGGAPSGYLGSSAGWSFLLSSAVPMTHTSVSASCDSVVADMS